MLEPMSGGTKVTIRAFRGAGDAEGVAPEPRSVRPGRVFPAAQCLVDVPRSRLKALPPRYRLFFDQSSSTPQLSVSLRYAPGALSTG